MHTQQSRWVYRFRPHSACCSYSQKPSIVMFPSIYRCVFFFFPFFPTLNNRISDILWGGKLIFFSLFLSLSTTVHLVHHFPKHNKNALIIYYTRLYCIIYEYYIHREQWQRAAECGVGYRCSGWVKLHMRSENKIFVYHLLCCVPPPG